MTFEKEIELNEAYYGGQAVPFVAFNPIEKVLDKLLKEPIAIHQLFERIDDRLMDIESHIRGETI